MNPKNHTHPRRNPESGQAIVLMALLMIALIGFLGVAIDGGGLFLLWRNEQNAVDAAVLAASYARCTGNARLLTASELHSKVVSAGLESAEKNGFVHNGTTVNVTVNNPPPDGVGAGNPNFTEVVITADKPSYFIQVVYPGPLRVTNSAVGMCEPYFDPSMVPGLWAGSLDCENTVNDAVGEPDLNELQQVVGTIQRKGYDERWLECPYIPNGLVKCRTKPRGLLIWLSRRAICM